MRKGVAVTFHLKIYTTKWGLFPSLDYNLSAKACCAHPAGHFCWRCAFLCVNRLLMKISIYKMFGLRSCFKRGLRYLDRCLENMLWHLGEILKLYFVGIGCLLDEFPLKFSRVLRKRVFFYVFTYLVTLLVSCWTIQLMYFATFPLCRFSISDPVSSYLLQGRWKTFFTIVQVIWLRYLLLQP